MNPVDFETLAMNAASVYRASLEGQGTDFTQEYRDYLVLEIARGLFQLKMQIDMGRR
jgi:hypothetical protein